MRFLQNLLSTLLSMGYTYNATVQQIFDATNDIENEFINSVNDFVALMLDDTIQSTSPYYEGANVAILYFNTKNVNAGEFIAKELKGTSIASADAPQYVGQVVLNNISWKFLQCWAYNVSIGNVEFNLNASGGLIHVSRLSTDQLLTALGCDVESLKQDKSNLSGYLQFKSIWEYLQSQPNFSVNQNCWIIDETTRLISRDRSRPGFSLIYPIGSGTSNTIDIPYGTIGTTVGIYENTDTPGMQVLGNNHYYVFLDSNGDALNCQYLHWYYSKTDGVVTSLRYTGDYQYFLDSGSQIDTRNEANVVAQWLVAPPVQSSYIGVDEVPAEITDESEGRNQQGSWGVITKSNNIDIDGNVVGEYTFTIPPSISDVIIGVNSDDLTIEQGLEKIGCIAIDNETKTNINGNLNYPQIVDKINQTTSDSPETPTAPTTQITETGMFAMFNPTRAQVNDLGNFLWSSDIRDTISKMLVDPMDIIISLSLVPVKPSVGNSKNIKLAFVETDVAAPVITSQYVTKNLGSIYIAPYFNNFLDYNPYTEVHIYLPFIGMVQLDTDIVMGSTLNVSYIIDLLSGGFTCNINVQNANYNAVMFTYGGTMSQPIPLTGANYGPLIGAALKAAGSLALAVGTGGASVAAEASLGTAVTATAVSGAVGVLGNKLKIGHSGGIGGVTGFLGSFDCYAIIKRPVPYNSGGYDHLIGKPCATVRKLGGLTGFTIAQNALLNIPNATADELQEIRDLLASGVYINQEV